MLKIKSKEEKKKKQGSTISYTYTHEDKGSKWLRLMKINILTAFRDLQGYNPKSILPYQDFSIWNLKLLFKLKTTSKYTSQCLMRENQYRNLVASKYNLIKGTLENKVFFDHPVPLSLPGPHINFVKYQIPGINHQTAGLADLDLHVKESHLY